MQIVGNKLLRELRRPALSGRRLNWVLEVYPQKLIQNGTCDLSSPDAPRQAVALWAKYCCTWNGYTYEAMLANDLGDIRRFMGRETSSLNLTIKNQNREGAAFVLKNPVEGMYCVVRLIAPNAEPESAILYVGRFQRPGGINHKAVTLPTQQYFGGLEQDIPWRNFGPTCPLDFGFNDCLGNETLTDKSILYQQAFKTLGEAGCNKTFERCSQFGVSRKGKPQTYFYQGLRYAAISGSFVYVEVVKKKFLFFFSRKKKITHTVQFTSANDDSIDTDIPYAWGRVSLEGHPMQWVDRGANVDSLHGFCEGEIEGFLSLACNTKDLTLANWTFHNGEWGGDSTQQPDPRFPNSGVFSRLAYVGSTVSGSSDTQVDDAPTISSVLAARKVLLPDQSNNYAKLGWTDNPVHQIRDMYVHHRMGRIPPCLIDNDIAAQTAAKCDRLILDVSNGDHIALPQSEAASMVPRYRMTGYTKLGGVLAGLDFPIYEPDPGPPPITYYDPANPPARLNSLQFLRRRFTSNVVCTQNVKLTDFIQKTMHACARLYTITGPNGKLQIKQEDRIDNAYTRDVTQAGAMSVPVTNVIPWLHDRTGWLIVGVGASTAEAHRVTGIRWTPGGNSVPLTVTATGSLQALVAGVGFQGGSYVSPAQALITVTGSPTAGSSIGIKIEDTSLTYTSDGTEAIEAVIAGLTAFINAHPNLAEIVIATYERNVIRITYQAGYLDLDTPVKNLHLAAEEALRVAYVFENCSDLGFDNILEDSFEWNVDRGNSYNVVKGLYTSVVDDFQRIKLIRKSRAHINQVDKENSYDVDLSAVDNYGQAAEITKAKLIELRDCDLWFQWRSAAGLSFLLEEGDVVAVKHASGGTAVNYIPLRIRDMTFGDKLESSFVGQLYLTAQYLPDVASKDQLLAATLTPDANVGGGTTTPPAAPGGFYGNNYKYCYQPGGTGDYGYGYGYDAGYSPTGCDIP